MRSILLLIAALAGIAGCRREGTRELRVGLISPLSGPLESLGQYAREGAQLAVSQLERRGGLVVGRTKYTVTIVERDGRESPEAAVAAAQDLINREDVAVIIGPPLSAQAIPVARLASSAGVPMVTQLATHPDVTRSTTGVYRVCFVDTFQGAVLARFALDSLGAGRAAILYDTTSPFPRDLAGIFRAEYEAGGGVVVASEPFATGEEDLGPELRRIAASGAEVLLLPSYRADLSTIGARIEELGVGIQILGCDTMRFVTPEDMAHFEGAYVTAHYVTDSPAPESRAFVSAYREAYGHDGSDAAPLTYDAMNLVLQAALSQGGVDAGRIARGLAQVRVYEGVTGTLRFDGSPDPRKSVYIARLEEGKLTYRERVDP